MYLMLKEKKAARPMAIRALDYAMQGAAGTAICERFIEMQGLGTLFSAFMGKVGGYLELLHTDTDFFLSFAPFFLSRVLRKRS